MPENVDDEPFRPGATARDTPHALRTQEHNAFYESLPPRAQERFLEALEDAQRRGLSEVDAWEAAVVAAETSYPG